MRDEFISVIIPSHNERFRKLGSTIEETMTYLSENFSKYEVIVVDNASSDGTSEFVHEISGKYDKLRLERIDILGKGIAVKSGMLASRGDYLLFTDADLSTPIEELGKLLDVLTKEGVDIAVGSRKIPSACIIRPQPFLRRLFSSLFHAVTKILFNIKICDTQCGFKMFKRNAAVDLFRDLKIYGYLFDIEVLYLATKKGYKVKEVPIRWAHYPGGKLNILKEMVQVPIDLIRIKLFSNRKNNCG